MTAVDRSHPTPTGQLVLTYLLVFGMGLATLALCVLLPVALAGGGSSIDIRSSHPSPDGRLQATVFVESGGGAGGYSRPNVVLHPPDEAPDFDQRLLDGGTYLGIRPRWLSMDRLEIRYRSVTNAGTRRNIASGVSVSYRLMNN